MPADLHRKPEQRSILEIYAPYIILTCIIILVLLIIAIILTFAHVHAFQLTGTEANTYQNIQQII